ncbi:MAG TPA: hypothetical protein VH442_12170, partial [Micromonosporaceae bacterium]
AVHAGITGGSMRRHLVRQSNSRRRRRTVACRRQRVLLHVRRLAVVHRGRPWAAVLAMVLVLCALFIPLAVGSTTAMIAAPVGVTILWIAYALRLKMLIASGGGGPDAPPGAGVREPRRPLPKRPAGAAAISAGDLVA